MDDSFALNQRIAARVHELRSTRGLSLEALAKQSGVSRSMISLIERAETSATAVVLEKLAAGLGVLLATLFEEPEQAGARDALLARRATQREWRDPGSGYLRRNVSPPGAASALQIVEVSFPPGARVAFENGRNLQAQQQVWVLEGTIEVRAGQRQKRLQSGDCMAMQLDQPVMFHNPTRRPTRYAVVIAAPALSSGRP